MTRRDWLIATATPAFAALDRTTGAAPTVSPALDVVDHLLLGVGDLDDGIRWVGERTGIRAVPGGSHPGRGTRNALLALGGRRYLEIIAPDPAQTTYAFAIDVRGLKTPRLVTWAAASDDIAATARLAAEAGLQVMGPAAGSRRKDDGTELRWQTLFVQSAHGRDGVEAVPFFIQWAAGTLHPSQSSPAGCQLTAFRIEHPDAARLAASLRQVGIDATVREAPVPRLVATLATPRGPLELS